MPPRTHTRSLAQCIEPCLPRPAVEPPTGPGWLHAIKHDGFRIMARRDSRGVRLFTRNGYNFADRFPMIVEAVASIPVRSRFIDSEAIVVDESGPSVFELLRAATHPKFLGIVRTHGPTQSLRLANSDRKFDWCWKKQE
jgi:ATP-dependent DNA ligase